MEIYQHFRKDEQEFIDRVLAWEERVENTYVPKLTDFLDPREQNIVESLIGKHHDTLVLHKNGGGPVTERKRVIIAPMYEAIDETDFELVLLEASYPRKFITLTHRDVMGAFLSLGIKRKKLGDIYAEDGVIQIITTSDMASYVKVNLDGIKQAKLQFNERNLPEFKGMEKQWEETDYTVSSLRLDTVLKEIYKLSRKAAAQAVTKGLIKVNHKTCENPAITLQEEDLISMRGKGRSRLCAIHGQTKKGRWRITTAVLK